MQGACLFGHTTQKMTMLLSWMDGTQLKTYFFIEHYRTSPVPRRTLTAKIVDYSIFMGGFAHTPLALSDDARQLQDNGPLQHLSVLQLFQGCCMTSRDYSVMSPDR